MLLTNDLVLVFRFIGASGRAMLTTTTTTSHITVNGEQHPPRGTAAKKPQLVKNLVYFPPIIMNGPTFNSGSYVDVRRRSLIIEEPHEKGERIQK